ncbi:hypothetical protein DKG34_06810 [Streptomyces sp. NWU49]|nr:hypothetical protein DKG34_06810 [Streptomyces sp. NWU49]
MTTGAPRPHTLVAGVGNIFLGDDGFGVEVARRLAGQPLPEGVEVADVGIRGVHLAYQLLDGYDTLVVLDATARGGEPGTLYLIDAAEPADGRAPDGLALDGHRMSPDAVLALLGTLCAGTGAVPPRRTWLVGCEPGTVEEGVGLSPRVAAAVPEAVRMVTDLVRDEAVVRPRTAAATAPDGVHRTSYASPPSRRAGPTAGPAPPLMSARTTPGQDGAAMHEMSVALSVVDHVEQAVRPDGAHGVRRVHVEIGELAGVVPDALAFCFELACSGTVLEGAELVTRFLPGRASCAPCGRTWDTGMPPDMTCAACRGGATELLSGRELRITEVHWSAEPAAPDPGPAPHPEESR